MIDIETARDLIERAINPTVLQRRVTPDSTFAIATQDPRFDPAKPLTVNGFLFAPAPRVETEHLQTFDQMRDDLFTRALAKHGGSVRSAAKAIGVSHNTIYRWLEKMPLRSGV